MAELLALRGLRGQVRERAVAWLGHDHWLACCAAISDSATGLALRMQLASTAFAGAALCSHTQLKLKIIK